MEQDELLLAVTQARDSAKSAHKRIDTLEEKVDDLHELTAAVASVNTKVDDLANDMGEIKENVKEVTEDVRKVTERPAQWWDKLVAAAIGAIASGLVAALLAQILR